MAAARAKAWAQLRDVNLLRLIHPRLGVPIRVMTLTVEQRLCVAIAAALSLIIATILGAILWLCDGHLIYSLDDPYISLALGWHIGHGHYGINAGEAASPASSILYPFLLLASRGPPGSNGCRSSSMPPPPWVPAWRSAPRSAATAS